MAFGQTPPDRQAALDNAAALRRTGDWSQARANLKALWDQDGSEPVAALAYGNLSLMAGAPSDAESPLRAVSASSGPLAPFAQLLLARCLHEQGKDAEASDALRGLLAPNAPPALELRALLLMADIERALGRRSEEVATWRRVLDAHPLRGSEQEAQFRLAQALEGAGRAREAFDAYQAIYWNRGASPYARESGLAASRLARAKGFPLRALTPRQTFDAASRFFHGGRAADALDLLDAIPAKAVRGDLAPDVGLLRVQVLYALRENGRAVAEADRLLQEAGPKRHALAATLKAIWALLRSGDHEGILARGRRILSSAGDSDGLRAEALHCMGTSAYTRGRFAEAAGYFAQMEGLKGQATTLTSGAYKRAWCLYRMGELKGARAAFARLAAQTLPPDLALPSAFWAARCALESGDAAAASEGFGRLAGESPGYWSWRARQHLAAMHLSVAPEAPLPPPPDATEAMRLPGGELARMLDVCALEEDAARAFGPVYASRHGDGATALAYALLLTRGGSAGGGRVILGRAFGPILNRFDVPRDWLEAAYPAPYLGRVRALCAGEGLDPAFVYGIIQQESDFDESAVSPVGALGLMQLMPYTAAKLATELGRPVPSETELLNPLLNLDLGVRYLAKRAKEFEPAAAAASYNAGEDIVGGWAAAWGPTEEEAFLAMIPYAETRHYAAVVLWNRHRYQQLFATN